MKTVKIVGQASTASEGINVSLELNAHLNNDLLGLENVDTPVQVSYIRFNSTTKELDEKLIKGGFDFDLIEYYWLELVSKIEGLNDVNIDVYLIDEQDITTKKINIFSTP